MPATLAHSEKILHRQSTSVCPGMCGMAPDNLAYAGRLNDSIPMYSLPQTVEEIKGKKTQGVLKYGREAILSNLGVTRLDSARNLLIFHGDLIFDPLFFININSQK